MPHQDPDETAKPLRGADVTAAAGKWPEVGGSSETLWNLLDTILGHRVLRVIDFNQFPWPALRASNVFQVCAPVSLQCHFSLQEGGVELGCSGFAVDPAFRNPVGDAIINKMRTHMALCGHKKS